MGTEPVGECSGSNKPKENLGRRVCLVRNPKREVTALAGWSGWRNYAAAIGERQRALRGKSQRANDHFSHE